MAPARINTRNIGDLGENMACLYLKKLKYSILDRNYWKKWGEIDIVARGTDGIVRFIEVKTVSHGTKADLQAAVSHGTWRPEEQVHKFKLHQIHKVLETWLVEHHYTGDWQIDVLAVRMVPREKYAVVKFIENIT